MCGPGQARRQEASANTLEDDGGVREPRASPGQAGGGGGYRAGPEVTGKTERTRARLESPCTESL